MSSFSALPPRRRLVLWALAVVLLAAGTPRLRRENLFSAGGETAEARPLPAFAAEPSAWIGCPPLTTAELRGRVWVLAVWTFGCVNCVRSIPYANDLLERFGPRVGVLGIHSPEFDWERDPLQLEQALRERDVRFPTYVDQSLDTFLALGAAAWPAFYVVDRQARIRGEWLGEMHAGTRRARALEDLVRRLLEE